MGFGKCFDIYRFSRGSALSRVKLGAPKRPRSNPKQVTSCWALFAVFAVFAFNSFGSDCECSYGMEGARNQLVTSLPEILSNET
jgi:hypothetical protein